MIARARIDQEGGVVHNPQGLTYKAKPRNPGNAHESPPAGMRIMASGCSGQLLLNPGFESGAVDWSDPNGDITYDSSLGYQGSYFAWIDGYTGSITDPGVTQTVNIPAGCTATLTYYLYIHSQDGSTAKDHFYVTANGTTVQSFSNANRGGGYVQRSVNLSSYGRSVALNFYGVQTDSRVTSFYVDNAALTLSGGSSTPTPSPTPTPTATPTASPTPSGGNCNGAAALNGPLSSSNGTLATGIAKPFDFPVQHGCNGAGYTAAVIIDDPVNTSYVSTYLSAAGVTQTGSITNVAVDGGGSGDDAETDLDVQTISGLAPGANIIVYDMGSLADQNIEDAYKQALSDGQASVVNSSFGGCGSDDPTFESATNSIAQQGAAQGVGFMASAGDSRIERVRYERRQRRECACRRSVFYLDRWRQLHLHERGRSDVGHRWFVELRLFERHVLRRWWRIDCRFRAIVAERHRRHDHLGP